MHRPKQATVDGKVEPCCSCTTSVNRVIAEEVLPRTPVRGKDWFNRFGSTVHNDCGPALEHHPALVDVLQRTDAHLGGQDRFRHRHFEDACHLGSNCPAHAVRRCALQLALNKQLRDSDVAADCVKIERFLDHLML